MAKALPDDRPPTMKELSSANYKAQAVFFANGWWKDVKNNMESIWKTWKTFVELDGQQTPPKGLEGNELDQFWSAKLIETLEEEAMTAAQRKDALKTIDLDSNGKMSLAEYLLWKYKKDVKKTLASPQGGSNSKMREAQAKMDQVEAQIAEIQPKLEAAQKKQAAAEEAERKARELEKPLKEAEEELAAAVASLHAEEEAYHGKIAKLEAQANDESASVVKRNGARNQAAQLKAEDPLPLRKAKISQGAALKRAEKLRAPFKAETEKAEAARAEAEAAAAVLEAAYVELEKLMEEARAELEEAKRQGGTPWGAVWWMEREMFENDTRLPRSKQKFDHSKPFTFKGED